MIRYKELAILYISILQISLVQNQWNRAFAEYGSYYVPYSQSGTSLPQTGTVQYVPVVQDSPLGVPNYSTQNRDQLFEQYPPNGPYYPPLNSVFYPNNPTASYQGLDQANELRAAYPNQPIIIINNGGNGDTGGNSNNGNGKKGGGIDFGDLAFLLAARRRNEQEDSRRGESTLETAKIEAVPSVTAPPVTAIQEASSGSGCGCNNKCSVTHITIVLPSSGGTVSIEQKNKKGRNDGTEPKNKVMDNEKKKKVEDNENDENININDDDD